MKKRRWIQRGQGSLREYKADKIIYKKIKQKLHNKIYIYIISLTDKPKVHVTLQSLPQYQVFSKPKEQKENSKAETSGEHRVGRTTTIFLLTRVSAEEAPKESVSEEGEKGRKGGSCAENRAQAG
jgi:hypothetical protein